MAQEFSARSRAAPPEADAPQPLSAEFDPGPPDTPAIPRRTGPLQCRAPCGFVTGQAVSPIFSYCTSVCARALGALQSLPPPGALADPRCA